MKKPPLMVLLILLQILFLWPALLSAQGVRIDGTTTSRSGLPAPTVTIAVCTQPAVTLTTPCSPLATLYTDSTLATPCSGTLLPPPATVGGACSNPMISDGLGNYHFYISPAATTVQFYGPPSVGMFVMPDQFINVSINGTNTWTALQRFNGGLTSSGGFSTTGGAVSIGAGSQPQFPQGLATGAGTGINVGTGGGGEINFFGGASFAGGAPSEATVSYNTTSQTLGASYNNDTPVPFPRVIGTGTATTNGTVINTGTSQAQPAVTVTGAAATDVAICALNAAPVATWQTGIQMLPAVVTANTVTVWLSNPTAGNITPAATVIRCTVIR
jgi:hypothetical protein